MSAERAAAPDDHGQDLLEALGLARRYEAAVAGRFTAPNSTGVARGDSASGPLDQEAEPEAELDLLPRRHAELTRHGVLVYQTACARYRIFVPESWAEAAPRSDPGLVVRPHMLAVDPGSLSGPRAVRFGDALLAVRAGPDLTLELVLARSRSTSSPVAPFSPARELAPGQEDWLVNTIRGLTADEDPYRHLAAMGLLYRHRLRSRGEVRAQVAALLAGDRPPQSEREVGWVLRLEAEVRERLGALAAAEAERLTERLEVAIEEPDPEAESWCGALRGLLREREQLEGARLLLRAAGRVEPLERCLESLDATGSVWIRALPLPEATGTDPLLRATAALDPTAWWARPAVPRR